MHFWAACFVLVGTLTFSSGQAAAEENSWNCDDARIKDIQLKLKSGEIVRGRFSADTTDKVMVGVAGDKATRTTQTINKEDVVSRDWVARLEDEMRDKVKVWPAEQYEALLPFAQDMVNKGFKRSLMDGMKERQKLFTAAEFKLYAFFLLNNEFVKEAMEVTAWAEKEHAAWQEELAAVKDRLPVPGSPEAVAATSKPAASEKAPPTYTGWLTSFDKAKELAKKQNKPILAFFTGSDWCGWCKKLDEEVFAKPAFKTWAAKNVVMLKLDYPRYAKLDPAVKAQNEKMQQAYAIRGYPTVLFLNEEGKIYPDRAGYMEGGAEKWLENADKIIAKGVQK